jgi:hypothetical protein
MFNFEALLGHPFSAIFMKTTLATIPKSNLGHEKRSPAVFFSRSICVHGLPAGPNTPLSAFISDHQSALRSIKPTLLQLRRQSIRDDSLLFSVQFWVSNCQLYLGTWGGAVATHKEAQGGLRGWPKPTSEPLRRLVTELKF